MSSDSIAIIQQSKSFKIRKTNKQLQLRLFIKLIKHLLSTFSHSFDSNITKYQIDYTYLFITLEFSQIQSQKFWRNDQYYTQLNQAIYKSLRLERETFQCKIIKVLCSASLSRMIIILMSEFVKEEEEEVALEEAESEMDFCVKGQRQGIWDDQQLLKFMVFTHFNKDIMCSKLQRRTLKIFKQMARFIETRNSIQCRSQNQKLIKKYKSINKILKVYVDKIGQQEFNRLCMNFTRHPEVKYIINEAPPKEIAGHAFSIATQTEFSSDSEDEPEQGRFSNNAQKNSLMSSFLAERGRFHFNF